MSTPLLVTKFYIPPLRRTLVRRPRLIEQLNAGLYRKLTLISAPAGFGKTTLLSEWVAGSEPPVAWLSLDESDNDPTRFQSYSIAALRTIETNIAKGVLSALQSPRPPPAEDILTVLINDISAIPGRIVLVLDDYHLIKAQPINNALTFLLDHLPPQMHLVVATRGDPPLDLARLRAQGQLTELREADLRFTSSEVAVFLNQVMGLDLSAEDIAALERRTEGWIAGLQLAAISMQGRKDVAGFVQSFTGSHRFVLDYLVEEVLEQQSESDQGFLLQTSVLNRLTGSLCDAVRFGIAETPSSSKGSAITEQDNGQTTLESFERANLFIISLDESRRWYRYHRLFADLLRQRLHQTQPEQLPILHRRASEWYQQNGFVDEAIEHALHAEDIVRVANLIEEHVDALWGQSEHTKLQSWLEKLPSELVFSRPHLSIFRAWFLFTSGQLGAAERSLQAVELALEPRPDDAMQTAPQKWDQLHGLDKLTLRGRVATTRAFLAFYRGDVPGIIHHARQALEYLPEQDLTWRSITAITLGDAHGFKGDMTAAYEARLEASKACRAAGDIHFAIIASLKVAITLRAQGRLQRTIEICQQQMQLASESGLSQTRTVGWLLAVWGETLAELNDLNGALDRGKRGFELTERSGDLQMLGWCYICLVRILFSRGDLDAAEELTQKMENIARESRLPSWTTDQMAAWQARLWLAQGRLEAASQWKEERGLDIGGGPKPLNEIGFFLLFDYLVLTRILIAQGRLDQTAKLLEHLLKAAEAGGRTSTVIEIMSLQALTHQAQGSTDQAINRLGQALTLAGSEGFIRIFVDEGPPMAALLRQAVVRGIAVEYVGRLLAAFDEGVAQASSGSHTQQIIEPLSERELEVLRFLTTHLSSTEIAEELYISVNTVRYHIKSIYGKLNVHRRADAVGRAKELELL